MAELMTRRRPAAVTLPGNVPPPLAAVLARARAEGDPATVPDQTTTSQPQTDQPPTTGRLNLYGDIGWEVTPAGVQEALTLLGDVQQVDLHISSYGGDVMGGWAIYNALVAHPARIVVTIDGVAASMASIIAMAGDRVVMPANAMMMIHNPSSYAEGDAEAMRQAAQLMDSMAAQLVAVYVAKTGLPEEEISALMAAETWMDAATAQAKGFADEIIGAVEITACGNPQRHNYKGSEMKGRFKAQGGVPVRQRGGAAVTVGGARAGVTVAGAGLPGGNPDAAAIVQAAAGANVPLTVVNACIQRGDTLAQAQAAFRGVLAGAQAAAPVGHVQVLGDGRDRWRTGVVKALRAKAGLQGGERNEFSGCSLFELARASVEASGRRTGSDRMETVRLALASGGMHGTSDFRLALGDVMRASLLTGYQEAPETFDLWTVPGTLTDFRPTNRVDLGVISSLEKLSEGGEYQYGTVGETGETITLATYGKKIGLTRQAIINDDLGLLGRVPQKMGAAARRTVGNLVYAVLTGNAKLRDGKALFHADFKNIMTGAAPTLESVNAMRVFLSTQKDGDATVRVPLRTLVVPEALAMQAAQTVAPVVVISGAAVENPLLKLSAALQVVSDGRLDVASATAWYGVGDPAVTDTVEVSYLDGQQEPVIEEVETPNIDGVEYTVRLDAGVAPMGRRGLVKNPGA